MHTVLRGTSGGVDQASTMATKEDHLQELEWAIGLNRLTLHLLGVWPNQKNASREPLEEFMRIPFMILAIALCLLLPQMYALTLVIEELPLVLDNFITSTASLTACLKLFFLWRSKKVLRPIVQSITRDWLQPKSEWELEVMTKEATRARVFTISGYVIIIGSYISITIIPLMGYNIRMITNITDYGERHLIVQSYFPYDYSPSPVFELTNISQIMTAAFVAMSVSIPENYFATLVFHTSAQFRILSSKVQNLIQNDTIDEKGLYKKDFRKKLQILVDRHVHLISIVANVEHSFSFIIASQMLCMCIVVCCLGFQISRVIGDDVENPLIMQMISFVTISFTLMMYTLMDCFAGETLSFYSTEIFHEIYNIRWYMVYDKIVRDLIPVMANSKIPKKLTAGKIFPLSLATYCSILKTTGGYISMLIAINKR